jgi:hypothetical protein
MSDRDLFPFVLNAGLGIRSYRTHVTVRNGDRIVYVFGSLCNRIIYVFGITG